MSTEMTSAEQDEAAVIAVKKGDIERYRELVDRHERRVFAVAWSYLGDAALAEEVTQEAFICGYRRLWLIQNGARFSGWMSTIARRLAINLGLRHRHELERHQRWALENYARAGEATSSNDTDGQPIADTLRQTLSQLPPAHRECLVLFYLEGKSGAEAAAALGISQPALRVRLHRAKAAMRERLELQMEGSLSRLGPAKTLVPAIMAGVLASSSAKAAAAGGAGTAAFGTLAKFSPFKWVFFFVPLFQPAFMFFPALLLQKWRAWDVQRNYRDPQGFRATLHRQSGNLHCLRIFAFFSGMMVLWFALWSRILDTKSSFLILGIFMVAVSISSLRQLEIDCGWPRLCTLLRNLISCLVCLGIATDRLPLVAVVPLFLCFSCLSWFTGRSTPARMDHNLFLRAAQGMLLPATQPAPEEFRRPISRSALRAFARFLTQRQLTTSFCWRADGLILFLPPVNPRTATVWSQPFPSSRNRSSVTLVRDGSVAAHCGEADFAAFQELSAQCLIRPTLEDQVAAAASSCWHSFRAGQTHAAEQAVGQVSNAEIFRVAPDQTWTRRWQRRVFAGWLFVCMLLFCPLWLFPENLSNLKPVSVTGAQVRAFLNDITPNPNRKIFKFNSASLALFTCLALPGTNLFSPEGLQGMRDDVAQSCGFSSWRESQWRAQDIGNCPVSMMAVAAGWLDWNDMGLKPEQISEYLHQQPEANELNLKSEYLLTNERAWSWVDNQAWEVKRAGFFTLAHLRWIREAHCLDLVDQENLIRQIVSVQDLSAAPSPGQPHLHDWRDVRGLFFTPGYPALQDTYFALATLDMFGGLNRIDREACIRGILRRHQGRGFFTSPDSGGINEYHIDGSAPDTFAAFESLRLLGALDRVKDLDRWQFRVASRNISKPDVKGVRTLTWDEVQAWLCQQRLATILREHGEHPAAPFGSLLDK